MQKPDKKGRPLTNVQKSNLRDKSADNVSDITDNRANEIFMNNSFKQEVKISNGQSKSPIRAINVSRSPYDDPGLIDLPNKISVINRENKPKISTLRASMTVESKALVPEYSNALPVKKANTPTVLTKSKVIKSMHLNSKLVPDKLSNNRSKSPLINNSSNVGLSKLKPTYKRV